jgi:hypothetical protein
MMIEVFNDLTTDDVERIRDEQPTAVLWHLEGADINFERSGPTWYCTECEMKINAAWGSVQSAKLYALISKMAYQLAVASRREAV